MAWSDDARGRINATSGPSRLRDGHVNGCWRDQQRKPLPQSLGGLAPWPDALDGAQERLCAVSQRASKADGGAVACTAERSSGAGAAVERLVLEASAGRGTN